MKPKSTLRSYLALAGSSLLAISYSHAATLYWDTNGNVAGFGSLDGTWASSTSTRWSTNSLGTSAPPNNVSITSLDDINFGTAANAYSGIVSLSANQSARSVTFAGSSTVTLKGNGMARTLTLGSGGLTMNGTSTVTMGDGVAGNNLLIGLGATGQTWTNNSSGNLTILNTAATFTRSAGGTITFKQTGAGGVFSMSTTVLPNEASGIIGPWAFFDDGATPPRYAYNNSGTIAGYSGGTAAADAEAFISSSTNYDFSTTGTTTLTASRTANTIRYDGTGNTIDLGASGANTLTTNGILAVGASGTLTIQRTGGTGTLVAGSTGTDSELVIAGPQAITISAPISNGVGNSAVTYSGTGTLTLSGDNTYTGANTVSSGTLVVGSATALGASGKSLNVTGTLDFNGFDYTVGAINGDNGNATVTNSGASVKLLTVGSGNTSGTFVGAITGALGLTKTGSGTQTLGGNNNYTGVTTINTGTVVISHANALGTTAGNTTIAATGSTSTGGQLQLTGGITTAENITITGSTELSGNAPAIVGTANTTNTLSGNITLSNLTGGVRIASGNAGAKLNFTGTISQTGSSQALVFALGNAGGQNVTIDKPIALNGGALILNGNGSSVILKGVNATDGSGIGTTTINSGGVGLQLGISDAINTTATLTVDGKFNLANFNQTVNALNGASTGIVSNSVAGTRTLTVGNGGGSGTYSGTIITGTGNIQLIKTGVGTQPLTGVNTYTGTTAVNGGRLSIGSTGTINGTSGVSIGAGEFNYNNSTTALTQGITFSGSTGTLSGTGTITPAVVITSGNRQTAGTSVTTVNTTATLGKQTFSTSITYNSGSIFEWNLNSTAVGTRGDVNGYDAVDTASLGGTGGAIFRVILNGNENFGESFWDTDHTWAGIFKSLDETSAYSLTTVFNGGFEYQNSAGTVLGVTSAQGTFTFINSGQDLKWTAAVVPEPTSALAGLLLGAGLLRRRRR